MKNTLKPILLVVMLLVSLSIACQVSAGGPTPQVVNTVAVPPEVIENPGIVLEDVIATDPATGQVTVTLTQEQITTYIAAELANQPDSMFKDPQVVLQNGQADVYATVEQSFVTANMHLVLQVVIDENGQLGFDIVSGEVGNMPAPQPILDSVDGMVNQALTNSVSPQVTGVRIESATITDGVITITGQQQ